MSMNVQSFSRSTQGTHRRVVPKTTPYAKRALNWAARLVLLFAGWLVAGTVVSAQQPPEGPMDAPPEHRVARIGNTSDPGEPTTVPVDEVLKRLSKQEDTYFLARTHYTYRKTIRIQEFGPDGKPSGEYLMVTQPSRDADGTVFDKVIEHPKSTLQHMQLESEDFEALNRVPQFPLTTTQLAKYSMKYLGKDQLDEISCYIFEVKPKVVERVHAYFQGIVYIDDKYLEVVKTYGSWVNDLGDMKSSPQLPFTMFETYREFIDNQYWFPTYARSDEILHLKEQDVPVRMIIKWTDYKPQAAPPPGSADTSATPRSIAVPAGAPTATPSSAPPATAPSVPAKPPQ